MATGFEVFGAVAAAIALLNLARQGFQSLAESLKQYKKYGSHIQDVVRRCDILYHNIKY